MSALRHVLAVLVLVAALVAGVVYDHERPPHPTPATGVAAPVQPSASPTSSLSSTWYCPGGPAVAGGPADVSIQLANPTDAERGAVVNAYPTVGAASPASRSVIVPAHGTTTVRLADVLGAAVAAGASVLADGGGIVAEQLLKAPEGTVAGACATAAGADWYAPVGSTALGSSMLLDLLNPFPDDAIVDASFATTEGPKLPDNLQGLVVPAHSLLVLDLEDAVRREDAVSSELHLRQGRLAVSRTYRKGSTTSATIAASAPAPIWYFPAGAKLEGVTNKLVLTDPTDDDADVQVQLRLADDPLDPISVSVPAHGRVDVPLDDPKLAKAATYAIVVQSQNDALIVAERSVESRTGRSDIPGLRAGARRWVVGASGSRGADSVVLQGVGDGDANVTIVALDGRLTPVGAATTVPTGSRAVVKLDPSLRDDALLITSDGDVVVERDTGDTGPTLGAVPGVPLL